MSTDRELLEAAAKAAKYDVRWHENWQCFVHVGPFNVTNPPTLAGERMVWLPLDDDGDALRLAVKLRLDLRIKTLPHVVYIEVGNGVALSAIEALADVRQPPLDSYAATRRAIVRAAAVIAGGWS